MHTMHTWNIDWFTYDCLLPCVFFSVFLEAFQTGANGSLGSGRKGRFASGQWQGAGHWMREKPGWSKRNRKTHGFFSLCEKKQMREFVESLEYGQSINYNQFVRPIRVQVEKVFGDPKSSLEGTSSPEVCSCSSELSHVSSNMLPRGHGRYTVYVEIKTLARK